MTVLTTPAFHLGGLSACLPKGVVANDERLAQVTGVITRRVAAAGVSVVDLCARAAAEVLENTHTPSGNIGAVIAVSFTHRDRMPSLAAQVQSRLALPREIVAFDVSLACSGWGYGLYLAATLAAATGRNALLLDGDVQSAFVDSADGSTAALFGDAGTAALVMPDSAAAVPRFAFATDGEKGEALWLADGGKIRMDGMAVFRYVATDVVAAVKDFFAATGLKPEAFDFFVPHQPNVYMVRQLAKAVGFAAARTSISCDRLGNLSSASIPATIALNGVRGELFLAGFGGGLSLALGTLNVSADCPLSVVEV